MDWFDVTTWGRAMSASSASRFTYRAFVSYSHRDKAWADWLHKALEIYRVPSRLVGSETAHGTIPRRLIPIFRDRDELASADSLAEKVNAALAQSENLVVICSPASAASRWVNEEVLAYKRMGRGDRIFCLIVGGEPNASDMPGREAEECFCPALRFRLDPDGQPTAERTEPIAADARPGKDSKPTAKLRLIAGMLDVGFDALKQREQRRQLQRMTAITAIAVCVMAVTIVLAIVALVSRHRAVVAQQEAVVAKQAAVRRQKQAEGLVGFMLGDLNDRLAQVDRLDIMQAVDDKAMVYFQSLPSTDVTPEALAQRAKALEKIGDVQLGLGQLNSALKAFHASATISSKLAAAAPSDIERQVAYSQTLAFIGMTQWRQGAFRDAQGDFEAGRQILQSILTRSAKDPALHVQSAYLDDDIGHVLEARGQSSAAAFAYQRMLGEAREAAAAKPDDVEYQVAVGTADNNLGKVALQRGDLAEAIAEYRADDAIEMRLSEQDLRNNNQRDDALRVHAILGRTFALTGNAKEAINDLQQSVDIAEQLVKFEPHDTSFQDHLALYSSQLARLQRLNGDTSAATSSNSRAITILESLTKKDPGNQDWQSGYAEALTERSAELYAGKKINAARDSAQKAATLVTPMLAKHPDERGRLLLTMTAKLLLASMVSDTLSAQTLRDAALRTMQEVKADRGDPRLLALEVEALLGLNRNAGAQPLIKQLWNEGFRDPEFVALMQREHIAYPVNETFMQRIDRILDADGANESKPTLDPTLQSRASTGTDASKTPRANPHHE
ncbi:MAG: TIR domain-containing protein [Rhodanobacteraceae bacterium]